MKDGPPVIFKQVRIGRGSLPFTLFKFRSMNVMNECNNLLTIESDPRITRTGKFIRKYHLDELPQLFNILLGDMTFIGPRPEIPEFVNLNDPVQLEVLKVLPGLFDAATLHWQDEEKLLREAVDRKEFYRVRILPDKLNRSLTGIKTRSIKSSLRLTLEMAKIIFHG
jgi:lipopolysaccharide/colanic/teichoic acid biosynthesis glycosyltransferase